MKTFALNKKKLLLLATFLCSIFFGFSQTTLGAGDIAITGFYSDAPDKFTFVLLTDVQATTQIKFTDNGWQTSGSFKSGEGILVWTADTDLPCGTEVALEEGLSSPYVASPGTVIDDVGFDLLQNGDQILAYQGDEVTPTFLYAVHFASNTGWSDATNVQKTAIPLGLTDAVNAVYVGNLDNGNYDCSVTTDPGLILSAISTSTNWDVSNDRIFSLGGCTYGCFSCAATTTWDGSNWDNGNPTSTTEVIIDDIFDTATDLPGSFEACSLTITLNGSLRVSDGDYVKVENDITTNGTFIVNEEGSVVQIDDNANVIGSATVRKRTALMNNYYEYTYWSSPVTGETIAGGLTDSDATRRFKFEAANFKDSFTENFNDNNLVLGHDDIDDDNDDWQFTPPATIMLPGVGYASHHEETIFTGPGGPPFQFIYTFDGPLNNGVISVPVTRNETPPVELGDINWNLLGNPYPSAIDIDLFFTENNYDAATNPDGTLTGAVYLWSQNSIPDDANNGNENMNFTSTDYAIINRVGETAVDEEPGGDLLTPNRFIPSGQGFFVAYSDDRISPTGDVIFNNSMRVTGNNDQFFRSSSNSENKLALKMTTEGGIFNQMLVGYIEGATNLNDGMYYDAPRNLATGAAAIIYSVIEDSSRKFAIQGRDPNSLNINEVIPIGIKNTIEGETEFTLSIAQLEGDFMTNHNIYLQDNLLNVNHNLSDTGYTFTSGAGEFNSRFEIFFSSTLSVDEFSLDSDELKISNERDNYLGISTNKESKISNIKIFDLLGRELYNINGYEDTRIEFDIRPLSNSIFIINATLANRKKLTKKFLNQ